MPLHVVQQIITFELAHYQSWHSLFDKILEPVTPPRAKALVTRKILATFDMLKIKRRAIYIIERIIDLIQKIKEIFWRSANLL